MGEYKDINDSIYERLMLDLEELGYDNIPDNLKNKIVDLIDCQEGEAYRQLLNEIIKILNKKKE